VFVCLAVSYEIYERRLLACLWVSYMPCSLHCLNVFFCAQVAGWIHKDRLEWVMESNHSLPFR